MWLGRVYPKHVTLAQCAPASPFFLSENNTEESSKQGESLIHERCFRFSFCSHLRKGPIFAPCNLQTQRNSLVIRQYASLNYNEGCCNFVATVVHTSKQAKNTTFRFKHKQLTENTTISLQISQLPRPRVLQPTPCRACPKGDNKHCVENRENCLSEKRHFLVKNTYRPTDPSSAFEFLSESFLMTSS